EIMLPIGRWKGYGDGTDHQGVRWETVTWACGLLAKTERLTVCGTVHAPLIPPPIAAKEEFVTRPLHAIDDNGDWAAGANILAMNNIRPQMHSSDELRRIRSHQAKAMGRLPLVGDPDSVAQDMAGSAALGSEGSPSHSSTISTSCRSSAPRC